ncbi:hypothetical protein NEHOM01_0941 [Nematocida homosporus]|uniref:uncharacterized protein n=1 Tax=Nematocida homosporus TaxID=1912981 RepID=UPI00222096F2|nr:uncharacterized protein NEHOM01_0941 [Nematocida homosporus]KAI5185615.1 hypothetical protein NEHOM01_0941 [Nematocida homosporus]
MAYSAPKHTSPMNTRKGSPSNRPSAVSALVPLDDTHDILCRNMPPNALFFCSSCKEVLLQRNIPNHHCVEVTRPNELLETFYNTRCAVPDPESGVECARSLNCKVHSAHLKRAVTKRTIAYDVLIKKNAEEKKRKKSSGVDLEEERPEKKKKRKEKKDKVSDSYVKLEDNITSRILAHVPVIEKTFCLPDIKFNTLAIRSIFFQPLKIQRMLQEKKMARHQ